MMVRIPSLALASLLLSACGMGIVDRTPPGDGATTAEVRAHCRQATSAQRAADLDGPGQPDGPQGPILPRAQTRASDADYVNCLRRYGVAP